MNRTIFVGRQPIINKDRNIIAYEILFRSTEENSSGVTVLDNLSATANVLENIYDIGIKKLMGEKLAFINVTPDILKKGMTELLPKDKVVLEILETSKIDANAVSTIKEFKDKGFKIALDDFVYLEEWEPLLELADYVKLDVLQYSKPEIKEMLLLLKNYGMKFIAEKVELPEDFLFYKGLGFDLFQGYFFEKPSVISSIILNANHATLLDIFNAFNDNEDIDKIENLFKMAPNIIYRLLSLINSVAYGFIAEISSVKQAIALLGYDNVSRWILTIILASKNGDFSSDPLLESAVIKGRMMENICKKFINPELSDKAFLAGMLSLVNVALEISMKELFNKIKIAPAIYDALIKREGKLGELAEFMEKYNNKDYTAASVILKKINQSASLPEIFNINNEAVVYLEGMKKSNQI